MSLSLVKPDAEGRLQQFFEDVGGHYKNSVGYPVAKDFDYRKLFPFLEMSLNNCGDPYSDVTYKVHSRTFEREVIDFVAELFRGEKKDTWGYVTNGGTEGNLYGLYLARQTFPDAVCYYSKAAHYSIPKNVNILGIPGVAVGVDQHDELDYEDLFQKLDPTKPAIILASIGTTMREARDDIGIIQDQLKQKRITNFYIHCDAALDGMIAPFLDPRPKFDFADGADSIAVSGHKFLGCPLPCGVVLCKKKAVEAVRTYVPYIDGYDETISGSRSGITPLFLWYAITKDGYTGLRQRVFNCLKTALYAKGRLEALGVDVALKEGSITLVFPKPQSWVIDKWQLATQGEVSHLLTVPGITVGLIDAFVADMERSLKNI